MNEILSNISDYQYIGIGIIVFLFLIQIFGLSKINRIVNHRHRFRLKNENDIPPVSVVVIVGDDVDYVYDELPNLLNQDHPNYEVVVVNDCGGAEVTNALATLSASNPKLRYTVIKADDRFKHSRKIALVVGIKAAKYNNVVFTHTCAMPISERWLSFMAKGFVGSDIVISYAGYQSKKGLASQLIRASWLKTSINYLSSAIKGNAYRGTMYNIGYTKDIFFKSRGYTHLRLVLGEDDLFIRKIVNRENVAVIVNPHTTLRMPIGGGKKSLKWWWKYKRFYSYSYRYYPLGVKFRDFFEGLSRFFYLLSMGVGLTFSVLSIIGINYGFTMSYPIFMLSFVLFLGLFREFFLMRSYYKLSDRLGEKGFGLGYFIHDKVSPISSLIMSLSRRMRPPQGLWN